MKLKSIITASAAFLAGTSAASATTIFTDFGDYTAAAGPQTAITFEGLSQGEVLTNQFAADGVTFSDGDDTVTTDPAFVLDGIGMTDVGGSVTINFDGDNTSFGVAFPGAAHVELYDGITLVASGDFGSSGLDFFGGFLLMGGLTFDRVVMSDFVDAKGFYDNIYFGGSQVPLPAALPLFLGGLGLMSLSRRRRKQLAK